MCPAAWLLALGLVGSPLLARAAPRLVDSLVAVVGDEPVLRSDVDREVVLLRARGPVERLADPITDEERMRVLELLVDRFVVHLEARRLSLFAPSPAEVAAERASLETSAPVFLDAWHDRGWSDGSLEACLARRLQAARYVDSRARFAPGGGTTLPRRSGGPEAPSDSPAASVVAELRRRARVVVVGFATGVRGIGRTSGRVSASEGER
jgi:hypothetical protein